FGSGGGARVLDVPDRNWCTRPDGVGGPPPGGGRARVEHTTRQLPAGRTHHELVVFEQTDDGCIGADQCRGLGNDLVEDGRRIELGREQGARSGQLLRKPACAALALVELAPLQCPACRSGEVARQLEVVVAETAGYREGEDGGAGPRPRRPRP